METRWYCRVGGGIPATVRVRGPERVEVQPALLRAQPSVPGRGGDQRVLMWHLRERTIFAWCPRSDLMHARQGLVEGWRSALRGSHALNAPVGARRWYQPKSTIW